MRIAGVIAEYNPFHTGHARQLALTREAGATHIAVVMSGSFVQRGDIAVCSKFARAKAAVQGGADLVAELPAPYAVAAARTFARAGVSLLARLGMEQLSFGNEAGNLSVLEQTAALLREAEESAAMTAYLEEGMSFPRARAAALSALSGEEWAGIASGANNLLGIEYLHALRALAPGVRPLSIRREGAGHDGGAAGGYASASHLCQLLREGNWDAAAPYLPDGMADGLLDEIERKRAPVSMERLERLLLWKLREMGRDGFARLPDVSAGLENRLARAATNAESFNDFCMKVKNKRHTLARIRRIGWCALLGIQREMQTEPPAYLRVLALNKRGAEILAAAKHRQGIPIGVNFADLARLNPNGLETERRATDLFALGMPLPGAMGMDFTEPIDFNYNRNL